MTQTTFENTYNQFTPKVFSNPIIGKLTVLIDQSGQLWFIGKEVARGLGYADSYAAIRDLVNKEFKFKYNGKLETGDSPVSSWGGSRSAILISEQGLYQLISQSQLDNPQVEEFKKWMFKTIQDMREYGISMSDQFVDNLEQIEDIDEMRSIAKNLKRSNQQQQDTIREMMPKVNYYDEAMQNTSTTPITILASDYGMSPQEFHTLLNQMGIIYKVSKTWVLYNKYTGQGYTRSQLVTIEQSDGQIIQAEVATNWTESGRKFIYDILASQNIYPNNRQDRIVPNSFSNLSIIDIANMIIDNNRRQQQMMQDIRFIQQQLQNQPSNIYNNSSVYYGQQANQIYKPSPVSHIGPDGREYMDKTGHLVVMTDKNGIPLGDD